MKPGTSQTQQETPKKDKDDKKTSFKKDDKGSASKGGQEKDDKGTTSKDDKKKTDKKVSNKTLKKKTAAFVRRSVRALRCPFFFSPPGPRSQTSWWASPPAGTTI